MEFYLVTLILAVIKIGLLFLFLFLRCRKKNKVPQGVQIVNNSNYSQRPRQFQVSVINMNEGNSAPSGPPPPPYQSYKEESVAIVISMEDKDHLPSYTQAIAETHNSSNHLPPKS